MTTNEIDRTKKCFAFIERLQAIRCQAFDAVEALRLEAAADESWLVEDAEFGGFANTMADAINPRVINQAMYELIGRVSDVH